MSKEVKKISIEQARNIISGDQYSEDSNEAYKTHLDEIDLIKSELEQQSNAFIDDLIGFGVDIVEIAHMQKILDTTPNFTRQVFSKEEAKYCDKSSNPAAHYAARFAAKEAVVKGLGTGFAHGIWVHDIEVERKRSGRPIVRLSGAARELAKKKGVRSVTLSMSYTQHNAIACAMIITDRSLKVQEERKDPHEELSRQFKEARKFLDEI